MNAKTTTTTKGATGATGATGPATPATPRKPAEARVYKIKDRITGDVIYVIGKNRSQVENFATYRRFDTSILSVREAIGLKPEDVLDATTQPGPVAQQSLPPT
jgi:hypothetical protein